MDSMVSIKGHGPMSRLGATSRSLRLVALAALAAALTAAAAAVVAAVMTAEVRSRLLLPLPERSPPRSLISSMRRSTT